MLDKATSPKRNVPLVSMLVTPGLAGGAAFAAQFYCHPTETLNSLFPLTCAYDFQDGIANSQLILLPGVGHVPQAQATKTVAKIILENASERNSNRPYIPEQKV